MNPHIWYHEQPSLYIMYINTHKKKSFSHKFKSTDQKICYFLKLRKKTPRIQKKTYIFLIYRLLFARLQRTHTCVNNALGAGGRQETWRRTNEFLARMFLPSYLVRTNLQQHEDWKQPWKNLRYVFSALSPSSSLQAMA